MDLWIYTPQFELLGIVDTAASIIWAKRYRQCGDFELYVPATVEMMELLQTERWVVRPDDSMVCIIEKVQTATDEENGDYLTVTGRSLQAILDRRIIWDQTVLTGNLEAALRRLVTEAFISPAIAARKYADLTLAVAHGYTETVNTQYTGTVLLEAVEELCAANGYGFKVTMDLDDEKLVLDFYKGTDHTTDQDDNPQVVFSEQYDNLVSSIYTKDLTAYKSVALVAGEGEGSARRRTTVQRSCDLEGLARREMFVDARDISSNEGEITDAEYLAQLSARGSTHLAEAATVESLEGGVEPGQMYAYGIHYDLGDTVTVINKYGVTAPARVLEVVETWDENGYTFTPTFG